MHRSTLVVSLAILCTIASLLQPEALADDQDQLTTIEDTERFGEGDAAKGAKLYKRYCRGCHGEDGRGGAHTFMPHIETLTKKGYIEQVPDSYLYEVIADGGEAVGKSGYMPAWKVKLSEMEIKDIIAHIRSMPTY